VIRRQSRRLPIIRSEAVDAIPPLFFDHPLILEEALRKPVRRALDCLEDIRTRRSLASPEVMPMEERGEEGRRYWDSPLPSPLLHPNGREGEDHLLCCHCLTNSMAVRLSIDPRKTALLCALRSSAVHLMPSPKEIRASLHRLLRELGRRSALSQAQLRGLRGEVFLELAQLIEGYLLEPGEFGMQLVTAFVFDDEAMLHQAFEIHLEKNLRSSRSAVDVR
jgi:hypothetical protein